MASRLSIGNLALIRVGEQTVGAEGETESSRNLFGTYDALRDSLLRGYNWVFAMTRATLPALAATPAFQYQRQFEIPAECLRIVEVGTTYVGLDLTDYRTGDTTDFALEGKMILTDLSAPLPLKYVQRITDPTTFDVCFVDMLAVDLAFNLCDRITQGTNKKESLRADRHDIMARAVHSNAIQLPPRKFADDEWVLSRL